MGDKDTLTKQFMRDPEVFADAFNYLIYDGEQVIKPSQLKELDTSAISTPYGADNAGNPTQKSRDVFKEWVAMSDDNATYLLLGVENQSNIHYAMPARNMMYDAISYDNQIKEITRIHRSKDKKKDKNASDAADKSGEYMSGFRKDDKLVPVITLVIYFGVQEWDGPTGLHEMFQVTDERVLRLASDYKINLISPATLSEEELEKLQSKLKETMIFIKYSRNGPKLAKAMEQDPNFHNMDRDTATMLTKLTGTQIEIKEREETVDMCLAIEQLVEEGRTEGRTEGRAEGRAETIYDTIQILHSLNIPHGDIYEKVQTQFHLTDEQMEKYMK